MSPTTRSLAPPKRLPTKATCGFLLALSPLFAEQNEIASGENGITTLEETIVVAEAMPAEPSTQTRWLDTSGSATFVGQEEMLQSGVQDLGSLVKYDPNVVVPFDMTTGDGATAYTASGAASFNIRGIEGNRVGIEVDGIRQPPEYLSTSFDQGAESGSGGIGRDYFDPVMFQLVEIYKGGSSALQSSDAMGGVVSMKTLDPANIYRDKDWGGLLRSQYFSRNEGLAWQAGGGVRQGPWEAMIVYAGRDGYETDNNGHLAPDPMEITSNAWLSKLGYRTDEHHLQLTLEHYERDLHADMQSALNPPIELFRIFRKSIDNWQEVERSRVSVNWRYQPASGWVDSLDTQLYWQQARSENRNVSLNPRELAVAREDLPQLWRDWIARYNPGLMVDGRNRRQKILFDTSIYGFSSTANKTFDLGNKSHNVRLGVDVSREESSNVFDRVETTGSVVPDLTGPPGTFDEIINTTVSNRISFAPAETDRLGFTLQDEIRLGTHWDATAGLRMDYHRIDTDLTSEFLQRLDDALDTSAGIDTTPSNGYDNFALSPHLDLAYRFRENSRFYAGYSRGSRNPSAEELTMVFDHPATGAASQLTIPNPDLREETSHAFNIGYKAAGESGRFGAELFYTRYEDFIENNVPVETLEDGTLVTTTANRGEAEIYGFEMGGEWNAGSWRSTLDGWSLGGDFGYTIGSNLAIDEPLNTVEPWKAVAFLSYAQPDGDFGGRLTGTYTGPVTRTDDTTVYGELFRPDSWFTLDLALWWRPQEDLQINLGVNNIFDEKYWRWSTVRRGGGHLALSDFGGQAGSVNDRTTAPGRNFFLSATYTF